MLTWTVTRANVGGGQCFLPAEYAGTATVRAEIVVYGADYEEFKQVAEQAQLWNKAQVAVDPARLGIDADKPIKVTFELHVRTPGTEEVRAIESRLHARSIDVTSDEFAALNEYMRSQKGVSGAPRNLLLPGRTHADWPENTSVVEGGSVGVYTGPTMEHDRRRFAYVGAHEMGHFLGYGDLKDPGTNEPLRSEWKHRLMANPDYGAPELGADETGAVVEAAWDEWTFDISRTYGMGVAPRPISMYPSDAQIRGSFEF